MSGSFTSALRGVGKNNEASTFNNAIRNPGRSALKTCSKGGATIAPDSVIESKDRDNKERGKRGEESLLETSEQGRLRDNVVGRGAEQRRKCGQEGAASRGDDRAHSINVNQ